MGLSMYYLAGVNGYKAYYCVYGYYYALYFAYDYIAYWYDSFSYYEACPVVIVRCIYVIALAYETKLWCIVNGV